MSAYDVAGFPVVICPRCKRQAVGWPLRRADVCSPKNWAACIRDPQTVLELVQNRTRNA